MIENLEGEIWKDVVGYEGLYQVSNLGRVKSLPKYNALSDRILKQNKSGLYYAVALYKNKISKTVVVHRLVASAFLGKSNFHVDHIDGNRFNNRIENIRYCTPRENIVYLNQRISKSGFPVGVRFTYGLWEARIFINKKRITIGKYKTMQEAAIAYSAANLIATLHDKKQLVA